MQYPKAQSKTCTLSISPGAFEVLCFTKLDQRSKVRIGLKNEIILAYMDVSYINVTFIVRNRIQNLADKYVCFIRFEPKWKLTRKFKALKKECC